MRGKGDSPVYEDQVGIVGGKAGYRRTFFAPAILMGGSNPYGNAMMSHYPFTAENIIIPDPTEEEKSIEKGWYETRCVIKSDFSFEGRALPDLCATHFGLNPSEARHAVETVCKIAGTLRRIRSCLWEISTLRPIRRCSHLYVSVSRIIRAASR